MEVQFPKWCVDGYFKWYLTISHPHIIPPRHHGVDVRPSHSMGPYNDLLPPPPSPYGANDL